MGVGAGRGVVCDDAGEVNSYQIMWAPEDTMKDRVLQTQQREALKEAEGRYNHLKNHFNIEKYREKIV